MMKHLLYDLFYYKMPYQENIAVISPISADEPLQHLTKYLFLKCIHFYIYAQIQNLILENKEISF